MKSPVWMLNSALAILLLIVGFVVVLMRPKIPARTSLMPTGISTDSVVNAYRIDHSQIYRNDLFGTYIEQKQVIPEKAPERESVEVPPPPPPKIPIVLQIPPPQFLSPLAITLKGVIFTSDELENRAIIADNKSKRESLYRLGDKILDAEIIYIGNNKIIVVRSNGQQETLFVTTDDAKADLIYSQRYQMENIAKKLSDVEYIVFPENFVQRVTNVAQFLDMLDITSAFQKGKNLGARIGKFTSDSVGPLLGLRQGDIITSVNGIQTTMTKDRIAIFNALRDAEPEQVIEVHIMRSGQPVVLKYTLKTFTKNNDFEQTPIEKAFITKEVAMEIPTPTMPVQEDTQQLMEQMPAYAPQQHRKTVDQIQQRDKNAMMNYGGSRALFQQTEP